MCEFRLAPAQTLIVHQMFRLFLRSTLGSGQKIEDSTGFK